MSKVEYSCGNIFYKEKQFFCKFKGEDKVFSKVKIIFEESKGYG